MDMQDSNNYIDTKAYFESLISNIGNSYYHEEKQIDFIVDCNIYRLNTKKTTALAVILNELITNSYKYAFDERNDRVIFISMFQKTNKYYLIYKDNGKGMSEESKKSFGIYMVKSFLQSLGAKINYSNFDGLKYEIEFQ